MHPWLLVGSLALPAQDAGPSQAAIDAAIERGAAWLLDAVEEERETSYDTRVGGRALALYTLVRCGVPPDHPRLERLLAGLALEEVTGTYDAACLLLALRAADARRHRGWIEEVAARLVEWQGVDGAWGYPAGRDLSNTQYAALGLWAASEAGVTAPADVWGRLADAVLEHRQRGGFGYQLGGGPTGSMTTAGIGTLAICEMGLARTGGVDVVRTEQLIEGRRTGLEWLERHFTVDTHSPGGRPFYYYLYGLERVGALAGIRTIGAHDWYRAGATTLVEAQTETGYWSRQLTWSDTCFALLFLKRATRSLPETGPRRREAAWVQAPAEAPIGMTVTGDPKELVLSIRTWGGELRRALEWPDERGRGPHVVRVEYLVGERVVAVVLDGSGRPAGMRDFAARWRPDVGGPVTISARVGFRTAPERRDRPGALTVLSGSAPVLELPARPRDALPRPWSPNLLRARGVTARASSSIDRREVQGLPEATFTAQHAVDGSSRHPWLASPDDERPTLTLHLKQPARADLVVVTPAWLVPHAPDYLSRPLVVLVSVNGGDPERLRMYPDGRSARLALTRTVSVRSLELEIPMRAPGTGHPAVGIGEVELYSKEPR